MGSSADSAESGLFTAGSRYELRRQLGVGGMGVVYAAWDRTYQREVALKILERTDPANLYRFKREFRALVDIQHKNLATLYGLEASADRWLLSMELVRGRHFLDWVRGDEWEAGGVHTPGQIARLRLGLRQLVQGLMALHDAGKVHRDVKPSNILVEKDRVVLVDFGLVTERSRQAGRTTDNPFVGTATHMAPEQAEAAPVNPAADWYAVGVVLFEALTGRLPFEGEAVQILVDKQLHAAPTVRSVNPEAPRDLADLADDLLAKSAPARPKGGAILGRLGIHPLEPAAAPGSPQLDRTSLGGTFIGRGREMSTLLRAYEERDIDEAAVVCVWGESGVGKTALVGRFLELLDSEQPDAVVLAGRCYERESVPFKAFDGIIDALSQHLKRLDQVDAALLLPKDAVLLARMFPVLQRVPAIARVPAMKRELHNRPHVRERAFDALRELLAGLSQRVPLVVFIDDLQWADADSLALLGALMHPPQTPGVLLLTTVRTEPSAGVPEHLEQALEALGPVVTVPLKSLSGAESIELAQLLLDRVVPPGDQDEREALSVAHEGAGHPLFITELVRYRASVGASQGPIRLEDALWARVCRLPEEARALLETVCVAGAPLRLGVALDAAKLDGKDVPKLVTQLRLGHLARTTGGRKSDAIEPYHDRVREAVLAQLDHDQRVARHQALADALLRAGAAREDPDILIQHLEAAGDLIRAAHQAEAAALRATESLAFDRAAELYRTALWLGDYDADQTRDLNLFQAEALCNAGRGLEAADLFLQVADGCDAATRLDCQRRAAEQLMLTGHLDRGLEVVRMVLADIGVELSKTPRRALLSLVLNRIKLALRGLKWTPRDDSQISASELHRIDVHYAVAMSMALVDNVRGADFQARSMILALRSGERRRVTRALCLESMIHASQGVSSRRRSAHLHQLAQQIDAEHPDPFIHAWVTASAGMNLHFAGEFARAIEVMADAERQFREQPTGSLFEIGNMRIFQLHALRRLGRSRELRAEYDRDMRDAQRRGDRLNETTMARAFNILWLIDDDPDRALTEVEAHPWQPPEGAYHLQHWYELRAHTERDLYIGEAAGTRARFAAPLKELDRSLLLRVQIVRSEHYWLMGRLALAEAGARIIDPKRGRRHARKMASKLNREKWHYADVFVSMLRAGAAAGEDEEALRAHLREALRRAERSGLMLYAASTRRRLGEVEGDEAMIAQADATMREQMVRAPRRIARMVVPLATDEPEPWEPQED